MIKAVVKNGVVVLRDPLPADWRNGTEVEVERSNPENNVYATDAWMDEVESIASQGNAVDDERLDAAIQTIRRREKERSRTMLRLDA